MARGGHRLPGDAVDLVEGVRPQQPVVGRADEQLQGQRLALHVAVELRGGARKERDSVVVKASKKHSLVILSKKTKKKIERGSPRVRALSVVVFKQSAHLGSCNHRFHLL